jgi:UDP-3-O-[3-hydroxymyristoyl] glucosamine N-acyltransferase
VQFDRPYSLAEMARLLDCSYIGADDFKVTGLNEIHVVGPGDMVFVDHPKYYDKALQSEATTILINKEVTCPLGKALLISDDPFAGFLKLIAHFRPFIPSLQPIAASAEIGEGTTIQPGVFLGNNVKVGRNCILHANVSVYDYCVIGDNVTIHANTVIGGDAFYYQKREGRFIQFNSCGRVVIEDDVHIGANCTIDRGVTGDTYIDSGTKIDNLVHIGHDTRLGKNCLLAAQVGIAGCVVIEDGVTLWGQVGVASDIVLGKGCVVLAQSGVSKDLKSGETYFGSPAEEVRKKYRELATLRRLSGQK